MAHLRDNEVQYALLRLPISVDEAKSTRDVFVVWTGPDVSVMAKGLKSTHVGEVKAILGVRATNPTLALTQAPLALTLPSLSTPTLLLSRESDLLRRPSAGSPIPTRALTLSTDDLKESGNDTIPSFIDPWLRTLTTVGL